MSLRLAGALALGLLAISAPAVGQSEPDAAGAKYAEAFYKRDGKLKDCTYITTSVRPIQGGCTMRLIQPAQLSILTPFGLMPFKACELRFTAHLALNGEVVLDDQSTSNVPNGPSCVDVRACEEETDADRKPWIGRLTYERRNSFLMEVDLCLETNAGWFRGPLAMSLRHTAGGWRLHANHALVGDSGLDIDGEWQITRRDLVLTAAQD